MRQLTPILILLLLIACRPHQLSSVPEGGLEAYVPLYAPADTSFAITVEETASIPTTSAGKIYAYGNFIFQNEINNGIHVIQRTGTAQPEKIGFIKIPYNTEMAIRGHYLYANSISNLLVIDVANPLNPQLVKTIRNIFPPVNQQYPPEKGYFVCADPAKGTVISWELKTVETAACRR